MRTLILSLLVSCFNTSVLAQGTARTVKMDPTPTIYTRHNFSTVVKIPSDEVVEYVVVGDPDRYSSEMEGNSVFSVVPLKPIFSAKKSVKKKTESGIRETNVTAITKSGNTYPFHVQQVAEGKFDGLILVASNDRPKPKETSECDNGLKMQLTEATLREAAKQNQIEQLNVDLQGKVDPAEFIASVHDDYKIPRKLRGEPFKVSRIYFSIRDNHTYIRSKAKHQPAFYERDGKEKRYVNYSYRDGVYVIPGEIDEGCLAIGKKHKGCFKRKG